MRTYEFFRPGMEENIFFRITADSIESAWARMSWFVIDPQKWILTLQKDEETMYLSYPKDHSCSDTPTEEKTE